MKLKPIGIILAVCITALAAYIFYVCGNPDVTASGLIVGSTCVLVASFMSLGITAPQSRTSVLSAVVSAVTLVIFLCVNIGFSLAAATVPTVIIVNGIILLLYALSVYGIWRSKQ